jgi:two-component system OmpR family sensor kinase/two-component system sensor histidine kinase BaeS
VPAPPWTRRAGRPPWWPEDQTWPPTEAEWANRRRAFQRRIGCIVAFGIVAFFLLAAAIGHWISGGDNDWSDSRRGPRPFVALAILLLLGFLVSRLARRAATPFSDVMSAADRVAAGDYSVRVEPRGRGATRRMIDSFNEMSERLDQNERQRRQLLADVAHELRTPLAVIRGNLEGMLDGVYPRDDEHLTPIIDETDHMTRLLDDLRTLSVAEAGVLQLHREPTDLAALIGEAVSSFAAQARSREIQLTDDVPELPELLVDPVRLREVLNNLIQNALRYTPAGGTIAIAAHPNPDRSRIALTVTDNGAGIDPADLPRVFDRFTKSADSGGSGLGLAIAKRLVEAHGGTIGVTSTPNVETTFRIHLPLESA